MENSNLQYAEVLCTTLLGGFFYLRLWFVKKISPNNGLDKIFPLSLRLLGIEFP
jgi:hypothetical protein